MGDLTTLRGIRDTLLVGGGHCEAPDAYTVRVRHVAGHRSGDAITEWWGNWSRDTAEHVAEVLVREYGGRVSTDAQAITVVSGGSAGGRPPVMDEPRLVTLRFPPPLMDRLDAHARTAGTTRSALMRRGAELALADGPPPDYPRTDLEIISIRLPQDLIDRLDARKREIGTTRTALLRYGAEMILTKVESEGKP